MTAVEQCSKKGSWYHSVHMCAFSDTIFFSIIINAIIVEVKLPEYTNFSLDFFSICWVSFFHRLKSLHCLTQDHSEPHASGLCSFKWQTLSGFVCFIYLRWGLEQLGSVAASPLDSGSLALQIEARLWASGVKIRSEAGAQVFSIWITLLSLISLYRYHQFQGLLKHVSSV